MKVIRKWLPYWLERPFVVWTGQRNLKYLLEQRIAMPDQAHWLPKFIGYDYSYEYKKEKKNQGADALSRKEEF